MKKHYVIPNFHAARATSHSHIYSAIVKARPNRVPSSAQLLTLAASNRLSVERNYVVLSSHNFMSAAFSQQIQRKCIAQALHGIKASYETEGGFTLHQLYWRFNTLQLEIIEMSLLATIWVAEACWVILVSQTSQESSRLSRDVNCELFFFVKYNENCR